ncbi:MAG TPA: hypothetical protein VGD79_04350 [Thermoanaerobaculia bacterium]
MAVLIITVVLAMPAFAKDVYLSVTGKANGFFTDARIFNPSYDKDILIQARYLPAGNGNNSGVQPVTLTIPKRSMKVYDDAVLSMFGGGPALGAIRLTSDDDFVATQRIYQDARTGPQAGTLGQFVTGLEAATAKTKGMLIQLKAGANTNLGPFRTNWGGANPNDTTATVTLTLYDKNNTVAATKQITFQPFGVLAPASIVGTFDNTQADLSDAWISFTSDHPVFIYGSVVDSGSSDPTFIAAFDDSGVPPPPPPPPETKIVTVLAEDGSFTVTGADHLVAGDEVKFVVTGEGGVHGFRLFSPQGQVLFTLEPLGSTPTEFTLTLPSTGNYQYICTRLTCSAGHTEMVGVFGATAAH